MDPEVWGSRPWDLASISAWNLGLKDESFALLSKAIELAPEDQRLRNNMQFMKSDIKTFDKVTNANTARSS